jgi:hypothetical protein
MNELEKALAELAAAEAVLAAAKAARESIEAGVMVKLPPERRAKKNPARAARAVREVHHPESGLRSGIWGCGPAPVGEYRVRINEAPVIMKHRDATQRPDHPGYEGRECLLVASVIDGSVPVLNCPCANCNK